MSVIGGIFSGAGLILLQHELHFSKLTGLGILLFAAGMLMCVEAMRSVHNEK